jgi:PleD family two-component response regulator
VRISVGWAIGGADLLHDADTALAEAKRGGKDRALAATCT